MCFQITGSEQPPSLPGRGHRPSPPWLSGDRVHSLGKVGRVVRWVGFSGFDWKRREKAGSGYPGHTQRPEQLEVLVLWTVSELPSRCCVWWAGTVFAERRRCRLCWYSPKSAKLERQGQLAFAQAENGCVTSPIWSIVTSHRYVLRSPYTKRPASLHNILQFCRIILCKVPFTWSCPWFTLCHAIPGSVT